MPGTVSMASSLVTYLIFTEPSKGTVISIALLSLLLSPFSRKMTLETSNHLPRVTQLSRSRAVSPHTVSLLFWPLCSWREEMLCDLLALAGSSAGCGAECLDSSLAPNSSLKTLRSISSLEAAWEVHPDVHLSCFVGALLGWRGVGVGHLLFFFLLGGVFRGS